ncbi:hypothetical protein HYV79_05320 [Candidatus Woesearchaeota archaeon]|nr:hypothetical protein [Candidatus Woesearchaeota archaeon]
MKAIFLKSKEKKEVIKKIKDQWSVDCSQWLKKYAFLKNEKDKLFLINSNIAGIQFEELRISTLGLYVAELKNNQIRLSIEGSQLIGPDAKKNILEINDEQEKKWIIGNDLDINIDKMGFQIIKHNNDFLGTGKIVNNKVLNYVPKERRLQAKAFEE